MDFLPTGDGRVVIMRADVEQPPASRFVGLRGHAGKGPDTDAIVAQTRGE